MSSKRIVIFEDSTDALKRFSERLKNSGVELLMYKSPRIDDSIKTRLKEFKPQLIVIDLVLGGSREDGYQLLKDIKEVNNLKSIPIVVCSKLINPSPNGQKEKKMCLSIPGVVAAYGKIPNYPSPKELTKWIKED